MSNSFKCTIDGKRYWTDRSGNGLWVEVALGCMCNDAVCKHGPRFESRQIRGTGDFTACGVKHKRAKVIRELKR